MKDKVLIVTTTPYMIRQFLMNDIIILQELGYEVDVATNFQSFNVIDEKSLLEFKSILNDKNITIHQIDFPRSIFSIKELIQSYMDIKKLLIKNNYKLMHTHTPIASVISRFVAKNISNMKVIYTAHGFHFFKGAPIQNWIIFYPIEKWLSKYTDVLITINKEDFNRAKKKFKMKKIEYVPGVGINIDYIKNVNVDKEKLKKELNIPLKNKVIISVGELSKRKNHELVIKALKDINNVTYIICGQGNLKTHLNNLAKKNEVDLRLLGFRNDRIELIKMSDLFVFPSLQEGLPVALMEAICCEIKCIASKIRGNVDLLKPSDTFDLKDINYLKNMIERDLHYNDINYQIYYKKNILKFDKNQITRSIRKIYSNMHI